MLPSPTTSDANGAGAHGMGGPDLRTALLMPTPSKSDGDGGHLSSEGHQTTLPGVARDLDLMPTPRAGDGEKGGPNQRGSSGDLMLPSAVTLLGTPTARDHKGSGQGERLEESERRGQVEAQVLSLDLLPTPAVNDMGAAYTPDQWDAWTERMKAEHNNGNGHGASLNIEAQRMEMLPTPSVADGTGGHETRSGARSCERLLPGVAKYELLPTTTATDAKASGAANYTTGHAGTTLTDATVRQPSRWGKYAAAIARWESITRPAPEPTNVTDGYLKMRAKRLARRDKRPVGMRGSLKVRRQLAARFSEWMMGVPLGWITDVPGVTRNEALKAAGNGVVPQQGAEALRFLLAMPIGREIADAAEPDDLLELLMAVGE